MPPTPPAQLTLFGMDARTTCVPWRFAGQECRNESGASLEGGAAPGNGSLPRLPPPRPPPGRRLPPAWASGFPAIEALVFTNMGLEGTFPTAWLETGAFPRLSTM
jgi:hypothetical protein